MVKSEHQVKLRKLVIRDKNKCGLCGGEINSAMKKTSRTRDHKVPKAFGGCDHYENLMLAHKRCNNDRGPLPLDLYMAIKDDPDMLREARSYYGHIAQFHRPEQEKDPYRKSLRKKLRIISNEWIRKVS